MKNILRNQPELSLSEVLDTDLKDKAVRHSLFFYLIIFGLILIATMILLSSSLVFSFSSENSLNTYLLPIIIGMIVLFLLAAIISLRFTQPLEKISRSLDNSEEMKGQLHHSQFSPVEIKNLLRAIVDFQSNSNKYQEEFLAFRKMANSILANMNDGILTTNEDGNVSLINQSTRNIFGLGHENVEGSSIAEVLRNHNIDELMKKCMASRQQEMTNFETSPTKSFIRCIAIPLDPEMTGSILFLFQDLTHIHQLEIIRRDFVSNVSHELRTPLTSIKLIAETLQEGALRDPPTAEKFLKQMDGEVDNLIQMVAELLELSRIESGQVPLNKMWITPSQLIKKVGDRMAMQAERARLDFSHACDENLPRIFVDPSRLSQVLINLLHNAIKFTSPGGSIETSAYQENNRLFFYVKDTGIGIPDKDLERIFERFYKSDPSRSIHGTGLGLSISKHLVELHCGKIWAESIPNAGSTFTFVIPIHPPTKNP